MANVIRIKRRAAGGSADAPASLENAELAFNEQTDILYYGKGTGGAGGTATSVIPVGGTGAFASKDAATTSANGLMSSTDKTKLDAIAASANNYSLPAATSSALGGVKLASDTSQTTAANAVTTTASRTYGVQKNASDQAVVNVPWTDTVYTHPTTDGNLHVPATSTTNNGKVLTAGAAAGALSWVTPLALTSTAPSALGTAAVGTATDAARRDHVHAMPVLSALGLPTAAVEMNSKKITGLADPTAAQDAATKAYVDSAVQGLDPKASVRVATTANITLSAVQAVDGVTLVAGDRVLVKNQTTTSQNGIYVVATGAWTRATDNDVWAEFPGAYVFAEEGTANADMGFVCTSNAGGTLGTTAVTFVQFSGAGQITAGAGITKSGNTLSIGSLAITNAMLANTAVANLSGTNSGDNAANTNYANDYRAGNFVADTNYLSPSSNIDGGTF